MAKKAANDGQAEAKPKRRAKQAFLDGMEPESIPEIDRAADAYCEARDARMGLLKTEVERRTMLHGLLKARNLSNYEYDGKVVSIQAGVEKVKVKTKKEADDGEEEYD